MYRRTIASNSQHCGTKSWDRRNNSANASTVFSTRSPSPANDSDCEELPRRQIHTKTKCTHSIRKAPCAACYCNANPIPPVLQCEQPADRCCCSSSPSLTAVRSVMLRHSPNCRKPSVMERYTKHRLAYENQTANYFANLKSRINVLEDEMTSCETLNEFRASHYFETHDVGEMLGSASHTCLHKFKLDNRLKPQPENPDTFGVSRCTDCNRRISSNTIAPSNRSTTHSLDLNDETSKFTVTRGEESVVIEVPLRLLQDPQLDSYKRNKRRPAPANSMALRFQKGVY